MFGEFGCGYAAESFAQSSRKTYEGGWKMCLWWRTNIRKGCWSEEGVSEGEMVDEQTVFMAYYCAVQGN